MALGLMLTVVGAITAWNAESAADTQPAGAAAEDGPEPAGAATPADSPVALLIAALMLNAATEGSGSFAGELAYAMRAAEGDPVLLAPLDRLMGSAEAGAPSRTELLARFQMMGEQTKALALARRAGLAAQATLLMRDAALKLGIGELPASDPAAALERAQDALFAGRLELALVQLEELPPELAAPAKAWTREARTRLVVDEAVTEFRALTLARALR